MRSNESMPMKATGVACVAAAMALAGLLAPRVLPAAGQATAAPQAATPAPATGAAASSATSAPAAVDTSDPGKLIESAAQAMLTDLDAHRAEYRKDPAKIDALVDRVLLPHFDTAYSARLVLARHWNEATPEQRQRFVDGFYHSLLSNYGTALLEFTSDRLKVFPYKASETNANNATVRTQVRKDDGSTVAVNYSLHRTDKGWMAWDVIIEGISYVKSFRDDFGAEIDQKGLDAVIQRLENEANGKSVARSKST
jgi:phospholipid transport system substrate-binding protein